MRLIEIRQDSEFRELKAGWDQLLRESASDTIFLTWEWATAWWSAYGKSGDLRIVVVSDDDGTIRGIAPLRAQTVRRYGQAFEALSFLGDGSNDSDYLDFIVVAGCEEQVMGALRGYWTEQMHRGTVLLLNEIPSSSPNLPFLKKLAEEPSILWKNTETPCGTVRLPATWEEYLGMLKPRFRTKVRSVLRNLESRPEVTFRFCENAEQIERMLPILFDLHTRRWAQDGKPGVFGWDRKRDFYCALSPALLDQNWLRLSWLEWNGQVLACQYGFEYAGVYSQLQEGYEPASEHSNAGIGLRAWSIREFLKAGVREYDFLGGVGRHKSDWGAQTKYSNQILTAGATLKNRMFFRGPEWEERAKEAAKKLVPEKLLAARRQHLAQPRPTRNGMEAPQKEWTREAVATCYFHLRLPGLIRPVRDQYQLSLSNNDRGRHIFWTKRTEPAARILCFHRVNDANDPFFPAMSTSLFEQEMRYVARHYKVVSLSGLLEHLENGSTEPVLAITFDDGYQDNYQHAFPVLQRYGLPATIFLSTGSIDSRQPSWFEQLALAFKQTDREHLDLDLVIPRRFWMRNREERLASNNELFQLLRSRTDGERKQLLAEALRQLAVADDERKDKMLTWDQIRLMKAQGVDFGGHTVTHPFLSKLTPEQAVWEVSECKRRIEQELQAPADYFAYPNGREDDFGEWSKEVIRSAGYRAAVSTIWGLNYRSTDPMELRRGGPWEETVAMFASKLDWYQLVNG